MADIMGEYPEEMVAEVCSPTHGLCTKQKFLPSLFELKAAFDALADAQRERVIRLRLRQEQLDERESREEEVRRTRADETRPTYEQLMAKVPASLKTFRSDINGPITREQFLAKFPNVTSEQLDAVPNVGSQLSAKPEEPNPFEFE